MHIPDAGLDGAFIIRSHPVGLRKRGSTNRKKEVRVGFQEANQLRKGVGAMRTRTGWTLALTLALGGVVGLAGCDGDEDEPAEIVDDEIDAEGTIDDLRRRADDTVQSAKEWSAERRNEFVDLMDEQLDGFDEQLEDFEGRVDELDESAQAKYDEMVEAMREEKDELSNRLAELKTESGAAWADLKEIFEDSWEALKEQYREAKNALDNEPGG